MAATRTLKGIQVLRAVAALLVVVYHTIRVYDQRVAGPYPVAWDNGSAGVDVFFVISGLVMVLSAERLRGREDAGRVFLRHRFLRIVPLYWLATAAKIAAVAAVPAMALRTRLAPGYVLMSFLMLPVRDANGAFLPVLLVGWTLTFEMMFYLLFAFALASRVPPQLFVTPILVVLALVGFARTHDWPTIALLANPIVLEFSFGVWIGIMTLRGGTLPPRAAIGLATAGLAILLTVPIGIADLEFLVWGLPAAALVAGVVALEPGLAGRLPQWALELGDASYAIYLTHTFLLPVVVLAVGHTGLHGYLALAVCVPAGLVTSAAAGVVVHRVVEQPLLAFLGRRTAIPAKAVV